MRLSITVKKRILYAISLLYILLFVYAAVSKLLDYDNFRIQLGQSPLLSAFASWIFWIVPLAELFIVVLLATPRFRNWGLFASVCMMTMFTAYIFIVLHYSSFVPCSCGGLLEKMSWDIHFIFNIVFVLLGLLGLILEHNISRKSKSFRKPAIGIKITIVSVAVSILAVVVLFLASEQIMHHENPFIRRYPQHPIMLQKTVNLKFNSYYFAGSSENRIYLGNYTDPLHIIAFDSALKIKQTFKISFNPKEIPFKRIKVLVKGAYFYLMDGTVPCIFWGRTNNWKVTREIKGLHYFTIAEPLDSTSVLFRSNNGKNAAHIFSTFKAERSPKIIYNDSLLQQQIDGVFDTDGMLVYDEKIRRMIYVYYYRNEFMVADDNVKLSYRGHTIDTISRAQIKVAYLKDNTERRMATPPMTVNANVAVHANLLFVNSKIQGRFEDMKLWKQASIIDVYDLKKKAYLMSFAIYHIEDKKLQSFRVTDTHLYALIGDELAVYELRDILKKEIKMLE
ncbi:MauE/DoxX family redox-associated membrane protein [Flavobacterium geliluteum]|uniref:Methylamine utilisation protein MauE domain-containing protein n=1 Tax=Flavobacterium geliluteum TaxID=2816120 RepID=A0A940X7D1_9FLAO|nr:MauE/DoxX family redox-associated membrane protein [Flavobacterium geliluteum]MBP4137251.1 hypothetical protein [Flavobacterium geliluteum]